MLGGADNANGELPSYITGANMRIQEIQKISHLVNFAAGSHDVVSDQ